MVKPANFVILMNHNQAILSSLFNASTYVVFFCSKIAIQNLTSHN